MSMLNQYTASILTKIDELEDRHDEQSTIMDYLITGSAMEDTQSTNLLSYKHVELFNKLNHQQRRSSVLSMNSVAAVKSSIPDEETEEDFKSEEEYSVNELPRNAGEEMEQEKAVSHGQRNNVETLAQMLKDELEDVAKDIFFEAKWKIVEALKEAQTKQRLLESKRKQDQSTTTTSFSSP